jgi:hypothetical protein
MATWRGWNISTDSYYIPSAARELYGNDSVERRDPSLGSGFQKAIIQS